MYWSGQPVCNNPSVTILNLYHQNAPRCTPIRFSESGLCLRWVAGIKPGLASGCAGRWTMYNRMSNNKWLLLREYYCGWGPALVMSNKSTNLGLRWNICTWCLGHCGLLGCGASSVPIPVVLLIFLICQITKENKPFGYNTASLNRGYANGTVRILLYLSAIDFPKSPSAVLVCEDRHSFLPKTSI